VATVSQSGQVNAAGLGSATITVTSADGGFSASCAVSVLASQNIGLAFEDPGAGAFSDSGFTIVKGGSPASQTVTLSSGWASQEWFVDNISRGTGTSLAVNAADYTAGGHALQITVFDGTALWTKKITFTVNE
jgi:uncharacterized protein YjdB